MTPPRRFSNQGWQQAVWGLALLLCGAMPLQTWADEDATAGGAAPYLREGVGARALGMGNAQAAAVTDATAAYWNPAALLRLEGTSVGSQTAILGDSRSWNFLNVCESGDRTDSVRLAYGISWINFSAGNDLEIRSINRPDPDSIFGDAENTFLGTLAAALSDSFYVGTNLKVLTQTLANDSAAGFGWDLSCWQDLGPVVWGFTWQDAYSYLDWSDGYNDRLPALCRLGAAWDIMAKTLTVTADGTLEYLPYNGAETWGLHLGAEYFPWPWLALRAGVDDGRLTGGFGFQFLLGDWGRMRVDYALSGEQLPGAGLTNLFSVVLDFPKQPASAAPGQ
jgi:hypothetical protein